MSAWKDWFCPVFCVQGIFMVSVVDWAWLQNETNASIMQNAAIFLKEMAGVFISDENGLLSIISSISSGLIQGKYFKCQIHT